MRPVRRCDVVRCVRCGRCTERPRARGLFLLELVEDLFDAILRRNRLIEDERALQESGADFRICHLLGGAFDLPHAETHSAVLSHVAALNAPAVPEASARLAAALGADDLARGVYDLERRVGAPTGLRELGLAEERLEEVVPEVAAVGNPVPLDERAARELLKRAWAG